tara:strand:+ start:52 stop:525 length:474 start_codon:yes stop_codon:yes gene_type:complete
MKHVNAEMIKAVADNIDLVIFFNDIEDCEWRECSFEMLINSDWPTEHFLCLPQHNESGQCLHWLNGGSLHHRKVKQKLSDSSFCPVWSRGESIEWSNDSPFMSDEFEFRIKPKKEKRWIAYDKGQKRVGILTFDSEQAIKSHYGDEADSFHEIEVEV